MAHPLTDVWPLFGLRIDVGDIQLRLPDEGDLAALAALAGEGIHDPAVMPFSTPWSDAPAGERARRTVQWHWRARAEWTDTEWHLALVAARGNDVVGTQSLMARDFGVAREVSSGSWLGRAHQGQGIGTAMRAGVLDLAFAGLGAEIARTGAFLDNPASLRVSEKLGYQPDGTETHARRNERASIVRLVLTRDKWQSRSGRPDVRLSGLERCRALFGDI